MIKGMNNPLFHLCKNCGTKYFKKPTCGMPEWSRSKYCSRQCVHASRIGSIPPNKGKTMLEVNPNFKHGMLGKHHTPAVRAKIRANRAIQVLTDSQHRGLEAGRKKVWTPEMRARLSEVAKQRKLGHGTGELSSAWKGGRTKLVRAYRVTPRYKAWRAAVIERDHFACLKCGAKSNLEANHIITVKQIFIDNDFKTMDEVYACPILWDVSNGETLCKSCHRLVSDKTTL